MCEKAQGIIFNIQKFSLHDGPGIRTTVFMKGCPLRCRWCSNPESQQLLPHKMNQAWDSRVYSVEEVLTVCLQDEAFYEESDGGVTISGGEPFMQMDFVTDLLSRLKDAGIHTAAETTGCVSPARFVQAVKDVDLLLFDVKHYDDKKHRDGTGMGNADILRNFSRSIASGKQVLPRIPLIPGFNDTAVDAKAFSALLRRAGARSVQLLPFHQLGDRKYTLLGMPYAMQNIPPLHREDLTDILEAFQSCGILAFF